MTNPPLKTARITLLIAAVTYPITILFLYKSFVLLLALGFFLFALQGGLKPWRSLIKNPLASACLLLFCFPLFTALWSVDRMETLVRSLTMISTHVPLFILTTSIVIAFRDKYVQFGFLLHTLAFLAMSAFLFLQFGALRADSLAMKEYTGAFSNIAAAAGLCCLPFLLGKKENSSQRIIYTSTALLCILMIIYAQSRSALILMTITIVITVIFMPGHQANRILRFFGICISLGIGFIFLTFLFSGTDVLAPTIDRLLNSQLLGAGGITEAILDPDRRAADYRRTLMYSSGYQLILDHWLFGAGFGVLKVVMESNYGIGSISHNWVITSLGELGLLGFINILVVIYLIMIQSYQFSVNTRFPIWLRILAFQVLICFSLLLLQGLTRPLYSNPFFSVVLGIAFGTLMLPTVAARRRPTTRNAPKKVNRSLKQIM